MSHFISLQAVPLLTELASIHRSLKVEAGALSGSQGTLCKGSVLRC